MVEFPYRQFVSALGWTWLRKDILDFNLVGAGSDQNSGCLLISGGAIPARQVRLRHSRSVHVAIPVSFAANSAITSTNGSIRFSASVSCILASTIRNDT